MYGKRRKRQFSLAVLFRELLMFFIGLRGLVKWRCVDEENNRDFAEINARILAQ